MIGNERDVLLARARALAARSTHAEELATENALEILLVRLGPVQIGLATHAVVAVSRAPRVAPLPRAVAPVFGLAAWRGRPITVLTLTTTTNTETAHLLIVLGDGRRAFAGVLADDADDVVVVDRRQLAPSRSGPLARFALGVTPDGVLVLDPTRILDAARSAG